MPPPRAVRAAGGYGVSRDEGGGVMANVTANWSIEINTICPKCENYFDIIGADCEFWIDQHFELAEHGTENSKDIETTCPDCKHEFLVDLEY
jgi:hypothetical protein